MQVLMSSSTSTANRALAFPVVFLAECRVVFLVEFLVGRRAVSNEECQAEFPVACQVEHQTVRLVALVLVPAMGQVLAPVPA
jgi:hypothetical protein